MTLRISPLSTGLAALLLATTALHAQQPPAMDWVPPEAMEDGLRADDKEQIIPTIVETPTPKKTADKSAFTNKYTIELEKFGISNDGTRAAETSKGINEALQHAKTVGANYIIFPSGTYLISEEDPIILNHKDTIVDLNGATLQIQPNGLPNYAVMITANGSENLRVTNGTLRGDRDTHDYKTKPGTHEWGAGIRFKSGVNLEIDNLLFADFAGDGVSTETSGNMNRAELLAMIYFSMERKHLEQGAFSETGEKIPSTEKVRTIVPVDVSRSNGEFEFGYVAGYCGFPFIKGRVYQIYFLDADRRFIEKRKVLQYRTIKAPEGTKYANFEFNQPEVSEEPAHAGAIKGGWIGRVVGFKPPRDVHFHHNILDRNRRLGMAFTGGQRWVIEHNRFENNGGTNPAYGVDFEDGAELMQDIVFRKNTFSGNRGGDLVVCAGTELLFEDNVFEKSVVMWGRPHNFIFRRNKYNGGSVVYKTRTGVATIENNEYNNLKGLSVEFDRKAVADGLTRVAGQTVSTPPLLLRNETLNGIKKIGGTYVNFKDSKITDSVFVAGETTSLISLEGCTLEGTMLEFLEKGPQVAFVFKNNKGELPESGPGLARKIVAPARK